MSFSTPDGWTVKTFYQLGNIANGQVDPRVVPYQQMVLVAPDHIESGTGRIEVEYIAEELGAISGKYLVQPNDVIYSKIRPNLQKLALAEKACLCSADMYPITAKEGILPTFLKYILLSNSFTDFAISVSARSGMPKINRDEIGAFTTAVPDDPEEQRAIAAALSDADGVVAGLERVIAKKRLIKQGAMQDLLTARRRLPGFSGEWVETSFRDCFEFMRTGSASRSRLGANLGIGYVHYGDIHGFNLPVLDLTRNPPPEIAPEESKSLTRIQDGDVVMADASEDVIDIGKSVEIAGVGNKDVVAGLHTFLLRGKPENVARGFGAYIQYLAEVRAGIEKIATGSSVYGISKANLANIRFRLPPVQEQSAIATMFSDMDAEIQTLESRLTKARAVKEGMMQNLLTGRVRLV